MCIKFGYGKLHGVNIVLAQFSFRNNKTESFFILALYGFKAPCSVGLMSVSNVS